MWVLVLYFIEVTFASRLAPHAPPLVLAAVIGIALEGGVAAGLLWGAAAGILFEPFASGPVGSTPLAYAVAGWSTGMLATKMFGESIWLKTIWPCVALALAAAVEISWVRTADSVFWTPWFSALSPIRLFATALVTPWIAGRLKPGRRSSSSTWRAKALYQ